MGYLNTKPERIPDNSKGKIYFYFAVAGEHIQTQFKRIGQGSIAQCVTAAKAWHMDNPGDYVVVNWDWKPKWGGNETFYQYTPRLGGLKCVKR